MSKQNLGDPGYGAQTEEQEEADKESRRKVLRSILRNVNEEPDSTANLVLLVDALDLGTELDELVGTSAERQQRLALVRGQLEQLIGDLDDPVAQAGE